MRVSDAERDIALSELSEHFQAGRLTHEEFDERSDRALKARTGNDLRDLFTDLPAPGDSMASLAPAAETRNEAAQPGGAPAPPEVRGHWPAGRIVIACVIAAIVIGNVAASVGHGANHGNFGWLVPVFILLLVFRGIRR
jgi:uncharacterized protein DUF1707